MSKRLGGDSLKYINRGAFYKKILSMSKVAKYIDNEPKGDSEIFIKTASRLIPTGRKVLD